MNGRIIEETDEQFKDFLPLKVVAGVTRLRTKKGRRNLPTSHH